MSLLFNMLSRLVIAFLPRSKCLLIPWLQSTSAVILEPRKIKYVTVFIVSPSICHEGMGLNDMIFVFWILCFKPVFLLSSGGSLVSLHFLPSGWYHLHIWGYWYFSCNLDFSSCFIQSNILHDVPAYKLNIQSDNTQPWCIPFPIWNQTLLFHIQF